MEQGTRATDTEDRTARAAPTAGPATPTAPAENPADGGAPASDPVDPTADTAALREGAAVGDELARLMRLVGAWKQRVRDEGWGDRVLLIRLAVDGPRRATDLAADTLLDLSTVSRQIRSLVERGLVERRPDPEDGRGALLSPTGAGLAAVERYRAQRDQKMAEALAQWPDRDRRELARLLARFNDDFAERHVRPVCAHPHPAAAPAPQIFPPHRPSGRTTGQTGQTQETLT